MRDLEQKSMKNIDDPGSQNKCLLTFPVCERIWLFGKLGAIWVVYTRVSILNMDEQCYWNITMGNSLNITNYFTKLLFDDIDLHLVS